MALLSFAGSPHGGRQRLLPEWNSAPTITPTTIIDHSIVGSAEGAWWHFHDNTGIESHFIIDLDGEIWQLMDTSREADANLEANAYAISIETADNGDPDTFRWTQAQEDSLIWLHTKLRRVHPTIPNREASGCASPGRRGHGFHTKNGAPSCWTPVAKTCPGTIRKTQWFDEMLPAYLSGATPEGLREDDVPYLLVCNDPARVPRLVLGQSYINLEESERRIYRAAGVPEIDLSGHLREWEKLFDRLHESGKEEFTREQRDSMMRALLVQSSGQGNVDFPNGNELVDALSRKPSMEDLHNDLEEIKAAVVPPTP
jgi:hypothetical protein